MHKTLHAKYLHFTGDNRQHTEYVRNEVTSERQNVCISHRMAMLIDDTHAVLCWLTQVDDDWKYWTNQKQGYCSFVA